MRAMSDGQAGRRADGQCHVSVYSGPEPPSGGVNRPPLAVIAPHCTQLGGFTFRTLPLSPLSHSYTAAGHIAIQASPTSFGTSVRTRRWFGWVSRVRLPLA